MKTKKAKILTVKNPIFYLFMKVKKKKVIIEDIEFFLEILEEIYKPKIMKIIIIILKKIIIIIVKVFPKI
jgi:hypothetical protein